MLQPAGKKTKTVSIIIWYKALDCIVIILATTTIFSWFLFKLFQFIWQLRHLIANVFCSNLYTSFILHLHWIYLFDFQKIFCLILWLTAIHLLIMVTTWILFIRNYTYTNEVYKCQVTFWCCVQYNYCLHERMRVGIPHANAKKIHLPINWQQSLVGTRLYRLLSDLEKSHSFLKYYNLNKG